MLGGLIAARAVRDVSAVRPELTDPIASAVLPALESAGRLFALPHRPAAWITYYNQTIFAAAGQHPPATWDDLLAVAVALQGSGSGSVALQGATGGPAAQSLVELLWAFGGDPFDPTSRGARAAGAYLARLAPTLAPISGEAKFDSMTTALGSDRVALGPNWPVVATDLIQRGGKRAIAVYPGPAGPAGLTRLVSGQVLVVPTRAARADLALAFAAHLRTAPVQQSLAAGLAWIPVSADAFAFAPAWQQPVALAARAALLTARALPPLRDRMTFDAALSDAFRQIAFEGQPPGDVLERLATRVQGIS